MEINYSMIVDKFMIINNSMDCWLNLDYTMYSIVIIADINLYFIISLNLDYWTTIPITKLNSSQVIINPDYVLFVLMNKINKLSLTFFIINFFF